MHICQIRVLILCYVTGLEHAQASLLGEAITGKGILAQLNLETGIPIYEAEPLLLFFILFTLLGAIGALGDRGTFVDDVTGLDKAVIPPGKGFRGALGLSEGGNKKKSIAAIDRLRWLFDLTIPCRRGAQCRAAVRVHQVERAVRGAAGAAGRGLLHHRRDHHGEGRAGAAQHRDGRAHQRDRAARALQRPLLLHRRHQPRHRQVHHRRGRRVECRETDEGSEMVRLVVCG